MTGEINGIPQISIESGEKYIDLIIEFTANFGPKLLGAIIVLWVGFKVVDIANKGVSKMMEKMDWDPMLESFIISFSSIIFKTMIFISAAGVLGVETSSFIAMLAAAGFAVGMALSGTLQNFAGGVMILLLKPFKIGDYIDVSGYGGSIKEIGIFNTTLLTPDKKTVIIPNSDIANGSMINYSSEPKRRVDLQIGIGYSDDIDLTKATLKEIAENEKRIIIEDGLTIALVELGDNAVIFNYRFFVEKADYWDVRGDILETVKKTFDKKGIGFPFPQRDVHLYNEK